MAHEQVQGQPQGNGAVRQPGGPGQLTREQADAEMTAMQTQVMKDAAFFIECLADDAKKGKTQANRRSRAQGMHGKGTQLDACKVGDKTASATVDPSAGKVDTATASAGGATSTPSAAPSGGGGTSAGAGAAIASAGRSLNDWFNPNDSDPAKGLSALI